MNKAASSRREASSQVGLRALFRAHHRSQAQGGRTTRMTVSSCAHPTDYLRKVENLKVEDPRKFQTIQQVQSCQKALSISRKLSRNTVTDQAEGVRAQTLCGSQRVTSTTSMTREMKRHKARLTCPSMPLSPSLSTSPTRKLSAIAMSPKCNVIQDEAQRAQVPTSSRI